MSWGGVAVGVGSVAAAAISKSGGGGGGGAGGGSPWDLYDIGMGRLPDYEYDQYYLDSQEYLNDITKGFLDGDIPDFYRSLVETGSPEFENYLSMVNRDTTKAAEESAAARGVTRAGVTDAAIAKANADVSAQYRYQDFIASQAGKEKFLNLGISGQEGVRNAGYQTQVNKNDYRKWKASTALAAANAQLGYQYRNDQDTQSYYSSLLGSGMELAGTVAGQYFNGKSSSPSSYSYTSPQGSASPYSLNSMNAGLRSGDALLDKYKYGVS